MKRLLMSTAMALSLFAVQAHAQDTLSTTRIELQHKPSRAMADQLSQHEENLLKTLGRENPTMQAQAVQALRSLEQMFPTYSFHASLLPLAGKLKDENADSIVRMLAALALDELHSDAGDAAINEVAGTTRDEGLKVLCDALMVRSQSR